MRKVMISTSGQDDIHFRLLILVISGCGREQAPRPLPAVKASPQQMVLPTFQFHPVLTATFNKAMNFYFDHFTSSSGHRLAAPSRTGTVTLLFRNHGDHSCSPAFAATFTHNHHPPSYRRCSWENAPPRPISLFRVSPERSDVISTNPSRCCHVPINRKITA